MNVIAVRPSTSENSGKSVENSNIVAALDVGSTKVCCLIGRSLEPRRRSEDGPGELIEVIGAGHQATRGVRGGMIVDLDQAERSIRLAVAAAERMAGKSISEVYVNVSCGRPRCETHHASIAVNGQAIGPQHTQQLIARALSTVNPGKRILLHANPVSYGVDDAQGVRDPIGMFGDKLSLDLNVVTAEPAPVHNLRLAIERCHLSVLGYAISPFSSGRAALVEDEKTLGVMFIDMGGATTSFATFNQGRLVYADVVPVGGSHVTADLARGLSTTIAEAERLKTLHGSALPSVYDDREILQVPLLGESGHDSVNRVPRSMLTGIIRPRIEETFELIRERISSQPALRNTGRRIVLTGGASQLTGVREVASEILNMHVRLGFPQAMTGLPDAARTPGFAAVNGLLHYARNPDRQPARLQQLISRNAANNNYLMRVGRWIRESL